MLYPDGGGLTRRVFIVNGGGSCRGYQQERRRWVEKILTSRQDNALGLPGEIGDLGGAREHLSVNTKSSQTAEDQMARLAAKIQHQYGL